jgi:hypothetical protein
MILAALPTLAYAQAKPPVPQKPVTTKPAPPKRPAPPPKLARFTIGGGIGMSATSNDFDQDVPFTLFSEQGTITGPVSVGRGPRYEASAGYRLWRRIGIGGTFTWFQSSGDMHAVFAVPHPLLFARPREGTGDTSATRTTTDVHVSGLIGIVYNPRWRVVAYAGPSFTWLEQELGSDLFSYSFVLPYTEVTLNEKPGVASKGDGIGAHGGVSITRMMGRRWGIVGDFRGSTTKATLNVLGKPYELQTGGFQMSAGVRVQF